MLFEDLKIRRFEIPMRRSKDGASGGMTAKFASEWDFYARFSVSANRKTNGFGRKEQNRVFNRLWRWVPKLPVGTN
jgi:hypothetical protein